MPTEPDETFNLVCELLDGSDSDEVHRRLLANLDADPMARRSFSDALQVHCLLEWLVTDELNRVDRPQGVPTPASSRLPGQRPETERRR
ncbi:hypothetical protein Pla123a_04120 [Posidoniimonas polymericola]|uniref:Uncharacterized protein n=1 Tax=Posidoniimonas polymericola TaxID=2528002 RepID=A0A5C5ZEM4_9BACT|nr:hypothetical protein [Posidoniimonas polymericola]TWT85605.1 hypothetical protein Pla123a_04120 [Posidoniimonas polymericola]